MILKIFKSRLENRIELEHEQFDRFPSLITRQGEDIQILQKLQAKELLGTSPGLNMLKKVTSYVWQAVRIDRNVIRRALTRGCKLQRPLTGIRIGVGERGPGQ